MDAEPRPVQVEDKKASGKLYSLTSKPLKVEKEFWVPKVGEYYIQDGYAEMGASIKCFDSDYSQSCCLMFHCEIKARDSVTAKLKKNEISYSTPKKKAKMAEAVDPIAVCDPYDDSDVKAEVVAADKVDPKVAQKAFKPKRGDA